MHLADIAPSIFASLGLPDSRGRNSFDSSPAGRECLFIIDGLGASAAKEYAEHIPTIRNFKQFASAQTAFPSTTATSLATLMTGELPGAHGMLGYTVRVPRSGGRILNALKWDERVDPEVWQPVPTLFERGNAAGIEVSHIAANRYEKSGFTRAALRGAHYRGANELSDLVKETKNALKKSPAFAYVYANELDVAGHSDGVGSAKWLAALSYVDQIAASLVAHLPKGTRIWISADHGMVNAQEKIIMGNGNPLLTGVSEVAGETRARHLYLSESHVHEPDAVAHLMRDFLGDRGDVMTQAEAIEAGLFGATVTQDARDRMGDIILIARDSVVFLDKAREKQETSMVGHHGGLTEIEKLVPLAMHQIN